MDIATLLARGHLPIELPPPFTSRSFAAVHSELPEPGQTWTAAARFNLSRAGGLRRGLAIPNPASQLLLATEVAKAWGNLDAHYQKSPLSISRPIADPQARRALRTRKTFGERSAQRSRRMHRARFSLESDVSQCYGSLYTHSIPWALIGKAEEKARLKNQQPNGFANNIDAAVRHGQEGQTKGIPIGPDTSLAIAEAILCDIDQHLVERHPRIDGCALRFMDDLEVFTASRNEAEEVLLSWESELAAYELQLNPAKTQIIEGPTAIERPWKTRLAQYTIRDQTDRKSANDIRGYMSLAFNLARDTPEEAVISYAIGRFSRFDFGKYSWRVFHDLLLPAAIMEPSSLRYVADAFRRANELDLVVDIERLSSTMSDIVSHHAPLEHGAEVAWALWLLAENAGRLEDHAAERVAAMDDNVSLILLRYLIDLDMIDGSTPDLTNFEERSTSSDSLHGRDWLVAYEAAAHGWASKSVVTANPFFNALFEADVSFFQPPTSHIAPSASSRGNGTPGDGEADSQSAGDEDGGGVEADPLGPSSDPFDPTEGYP